MKKQFVLVGIKKQFTDDQFKDTILNKRLIKQVCKSKEDPSYRCDMLYDTDRITVNVDIMFMLKLLNNVE